MTLRARGELIQVGDTVNLTATFLDANGVPTNTDTFPTVSIVSPQGLVLQMPTSAGVVNIAPGMYLFAFSMPIGTALGVYNDIWTGYVAGTRNDQTLSFVVLGSDLSANRETDDGYYALGDDPGFNYSQLEIQNINKLLKAVRARLNSSGKTKTTDANGNVQYVDCDVFSVDQLVVFIGTSLAELNSVPYLTWFRFSDTNIIDLFFQVLVEGAVLYALAAQALLERGAEMTLNDNGVSLSPASEAELLNSQYSQLLTQHWDRVKYIKNSLRPSPRTLGVLSAQTSSPSILRRLTTLRARRIF